MCFYLVLLSLFLFSPVASRYGSEPAQECNKAIDSLPSFWSTAEAESTNALVPHPSFWGALVSEVCSILGGEETEQSEGAARGEVTENGAEGEKAEAVALGVNFDVQMESPDTSASKALQRNRLSLSNFIHQSQKNKIRRNRQRWQRWNKHYYGHHKQINTL